MGKLTENLFLCDDGIIHTSGIAFTFKGELYIGEDKNKIPEGIGILFLPKGGFVISRWRKGKADGYTSYVGSQGDRFEGLCEDGSAIGEWTKMNREESARIQMEFKSNRVEILSIEQTTSEEIDEDIISDLDDISSYLAKGNPELSFVKFNDGARYLGNSRGRMPEGLGAFIYPDFKCDIGIYKRGLPDKVSIIHFKNDDTFIGATKDGEINGIGILVKNLDEGCEWILGKFLGNECESMANEGINYPESIIIELIRNLIPNSIKCIKKKIGEFQFSITENFFNEDELIKSSKEFKEISRYSNAPNDNFCSKSIQVSFKDSFQIKEQKSCSTQTFGENILEKDFSRQIASRIEERSEEFESDDICNLTRSSNKRVRSESPLYPLFQRAKQLEDDIKLKLSKAILYDSSLNSKNNNEQSVWYTESISKNLLYDRRDYETQLSMPQVKFLQTIRLKTTESNNGEFVPQELSPVCSKTTETVDLVNEEDENVNFFRYQTTNEKVEHPNEQVKLMVNKNSSKEKDKSGSKQSILEATFGKDKKSIQSKEKLSNERFQETLNSNSCLKQKPMQIQPSISPFLNYSINPKQTFINYSLPQVIGRASSPIRVNRTFSTIGNFPVSPMGRNIPYYNVNYYGSCTPPRRLF